MLSADNERPTCFYLLHAFALRFALHLPLLHTTFQSNFFSSFFCANTRNTNSNIFVESGMPVQECHGSVAARHLAAVDRSYSTQ